MPTPTNRVTLVAAVLAALLSAMPNFASIIPAMTDASSHVLVARILNGYGDSALRFQEHFSIDWHVAPTALFYVLLEYLQRLFGPYGDVRAYLVIWTLALGLSTWSLARALGNAHPWLAVVLAVPLGFSWFVWMGFLPYIMTIPLFAMAVATWLSVSNPTCRILLTAALQALLFGFHIVGLCAAMTAICILTVVRYLRGEATRAHWTHAGVAMIPGLALIGVYLGGSNAPGVSLAYGSVWDQVFGLVRYTCASLSKPASILLGVWGLAILAATAAAIAGRHRVSNAVAVAAVLATIGLVVPIGVGALWPAGPRLLPYALILLVASLSIPDRLATPAALVGLGLVAALTTVTMTRVRALDHDFREFHALSSVIEPGSRVLPVVADVTAGPNMTWPYLALVSWITVEKGGYHPYAFARPYIFTNATPVNYRHPLGEEARLLFNPEGQIESLTRTMMNYDFIVLWQPTPGILAAIPAGICRVRQSDQGMVLARRTGAPQELPVVSPLVDCE